MKTVLFVCIENSCRSQMAEGIANKLGKNVLNAYSAGSKASGIVNPSAIKVMSEIGIDISSAESKGFDALGVKEFDYVISLGCKDVCPFVPANLHIEWQISDPKDKTLDCFRKTRDSIQEEIIILIKEM